MLQKHELIVAIRATIKGINTSHIDSKKLIRIALPDYRDICTVMTGKLKITVLTIVLNRLRNRPAHTKNDQYWLDNFSKTYLTPVLKELDAMHLLDEI
jgi:hypothetical protein